MISQIFQPQEFSALPEKGLEAQKIRALYLAYGTGYEFCRFYRQGDSYLSLLDGSAVLCGDAQTDYEEWSQFITMCGCREVFCSEYAAQKLCEILNIRRETVNLMKFCGEPYSEPLECNPVLSEVYDIIRDGFEIEFEPWYMDMSHRVRHGITQCRVLDGVTALVIQHDINGEALLSQVATKAAHRGKGLAARLVRAVSSALAPSEVYIVCEDALVGFYRGCGYSVCGRKCVMYL